MHMDLNADLGEGVGDDDAMMKIVSSANIACGGHAGDDATMFKAVSAAKAAGVTIGAHPGFEDREGFGRRRLPLTMPEISQLITTQLDALRAVAVSVGAEVIYVKPHGALGNWATEDREVAKAIVSAVRLTMGARAAVLAISGTVLEQVAREEGIRVFSEIFADRGYTPAGNLVPRSEAGAMISDPQDASTRLVQFFENGLMPTVGGASVQMTAHSVCIHGDSPCALDTARSVRQALEEAGFVIRSFL